MRTILKISVLLTAGLVAVANAVVAEELDASLQVKVDAKVKAIQTWAANPAIVSGVQARNASTPPELADLTQEKWKALTVLDPLVRSFSKNPVAEYLKSQKDDSVSEGFISCADGSKVAFLSKPTNWSHKGKAKHDQPMSGKNWQGPVEVDESTGSKQIQVAVPVLADGKPIGSLVVGLNISKLGGQ